MDPAGPSSPRLRSPVVLGISPKRKRSFVPRSPLAVKLTQPEGWCYRDTASYGHFGRAAFPWEQTDKVAVLKDILG